MRLNCKVIEDLLPLYLDNVCSDETKIIVEEHLKECEECKKLIDITKTVQILRIEPENSVTDNAVKKGFKKIRVRWWASIILVVVIVPCIFLGWNQYHNIGIHYTNINEYYIGQSFMEQLQKGNYEKAYEYIDIDGLKQEWLEVWFEEQELVNIKEDGLIKFCEYADKIEKKGGIEKLEYTGIGIYAYESDGTPIYQLSYKIRFDGKNQMFCVNVSDDGVESFTGGDSFITDPLAQFSIWSEYLWQDYEGCYYDPNLKGYIYYNK